MPSMQPNRKPLLSNTLTETDTRKALQLSADILSKILERHCGPFAYNAAVLQDTSITVGSDIVHGFTKDGITIARTVQFENDVMETIRRLVIYVGQQVDNTARDGTTTAMIFFCRLVSNFQKAFLEGKFKGKDPRHITKTFNDKMTELLNHLDSLKLTVSDYNDYPLKSVRRIIAFRQVMTTTKGNLSISNAIADCVDNYPIEKFFKIFEIKPSAVEHLGEPKIEACQRTHDFDLDGMIDQNARRDKLDSAIYSERADLYLTEERLVQGNIFHIKAMEVLLDLVKSLDDDPEFDLDKDIYFLGTEYDMSMIQYTNIINEHLRRRPNNRRVCIINMGRSRFAKFRLNTLALLYRDKVTTHQATDFIILKDVKIDYEGTSVKITNIHDTLEGAVFRPYYNAPEGSPYYHPEYNKFLKEMENYIRSIDENIDDNRLSDEDYKYLQYLYRDMITANSNYIKITSTKYNMEFVLSELKDALGSVIDVLQNGFVTNGFEQMWLKRPSSNDPIDIVITESLEETIYSVYEKSGLFASKDSMLKTMKAMVSHCIFCEQCGETDVVFYLKTTDDGVVQFTGMPNKAEVIRGDILNTDTVDDRMFDNPLVFQSFSGYKDLIGRVIELIPKCALTTTYIGAVNTGETFESSRINEIQ